MHIRSNKITGFIRTYSGTRYIVLFVPEKYDAILNRIRYLTEVKSGISYVTCHYHTKIKVDSYDFLPSEKKLTFHIVIILIKSVLIKIKIITTIIYS